MRDAEELLRQRAIAAAELEAEAANGAEPKATVHTTAEGRRRAEELLGGGVGVVGSYSEGGWGWGGEAGGGEAGG